MFHTHVESEQLDLHMKLLKQSLDEGKNVMDYIFLLKNIRLEIVKCPFEDVKEICMSSILTNGLPPSYKHLL